MSMHLSPPDLHRIRGGAATGAEARHLASCPSCAASLSSDRALRESAAALRAAFSDLEPAEHPEEQELAAYVGGTLERGRRDAVDAHLRACGGCRDEVSDLRRWTSPPARRRLYAGLAAAAATLAFAVLLLREPPPAAERQPVPPAVATTRTAPPVAAPPVAPSEWDLLVERVRATGTLLLPAYVSEFAGHDTFRGAREPARPSAVWPAGTAVEDDRPELRWRATEGATYTVSIIDGARVVAESAPIAVARWRPEKRLARGRTYA